MRKTPRVDVRRGRLTGFGKTKTEAKADLDRQIDAVCAAADPHIEVRYGWLFVIAQTGDSVSAKIIAPYDFDVHGRVFSFSCSTFNTTIEREIGRTRLHVAQNAWSRTVDDEEHISKAGIHPDLVAELRRWIKFQRSYDEHIAAGKTAAEAHQMAGGL